MKALEPTQVLEGRNGGPYAFRTRLGQCVVGSVSGTNNNSVSCNKTAVRQADTNQIGKHFFSIKKRRKRKRGYRNAAKKCTTMNLQNHKTNSTEKMMECHKKI